MSRKRYNASELIEMAWDEMLLADMQDPGSDKSDNRLKRAQIVALLAIARAITDHE